MGISSTMHVLCICFMYFLSTCSAASLQLFPVLPLQCLLQQFFSYFSVQTVKTNFLWWTKEDLSSDLNVYLHNFHCNEPSSSSLLQFIIWFIFTMYCPPLQTQSAVYRIHKWCQIANSFKYLNSSLLGPIPPTKIFNRLCHTFSLLMFPFPSWHTVFIIAPLQLTLLALSDYAACRVVLYVFCFL